MIKSWTINNDMATTWYSVYALVNAHAKKHTTTNDLIYIIKQFQIFAYKIPKPYGIIALNKLDTILLNFWLFWFHFLHACIQIILVFVKLGSLLMITTTVNLTL